MRSRRSRVSFAAIAATVEQLAERLVEAFNARDVDALADLVDAAVEFDFGPKTLHGRQEFREFAERQLYGVALEVAHGRRFRRGDEMVAESRVVMRYVETGEVVGVEQLAALYVASDGRLTRYAEFAELASAFDAGSVSEADEIPPP